MKVPLFLAAAASLATATVAQAIPIGSNGATLTASTTPTFGLFNLGTGTATGLVSTAPTSVGNGGTATFTPDAASPQAGVYAGSIPNVATSPFGGSSLSEYLVAEPRDNVTLTYASQQTTLNLLWGTVDTYNSLNLGFLEGGALVGNLTITGAEVAQAVGGGFLANGTTGAYVSITDPIFNGNDIPFGFDQVVAVSTQQALEFVPGTTVPEPATLALLGFGLLSLGFVQQRRGRG